ncbi:hypothetical protein BC834DRAFT_855710 [Gloeopeniophorella convolvens]|nr:hypothetical protein BC834DRAFT_855710 [Gloeopeniophorella convolvens]
MASLHDEPLSSDTAAPTDSLMGGDEQQLKDESRPGDNAASYVAFSSALILLLATWTLILANDPSGLSWFAFHPTLNTVAIFCFTLGILTLQPTSQPKTKAAGLQRHQLAMLAGFPAIALGTSAMWYNKASHGAAHYTTWHGTFGLISVLWLVGQVALGGASVWAGGAALGGGTKAKRVWKYHRLSGYVLLPLLLTTANLGGGWSTWATEHSAWAVRFVAYTLAPLGIVGALYSRVRPSKMRFF